MIESQEEVAVARSPYPPRLVALGKWLAVLAALATPLCYMNGRAFHDGYLAQLHLAPSMFPSDVQGTFIEAARAWMEGAASVLDAVARAVASHWLLIVVLPLLLVGGLSIATLYVMDRIDARRAASLEHPSVPRRTRLVRAALTPMYGLFLGAYVLYTLLVLISAILLLSTGPFAQVGARIAAKDLQRGFPNAPIAELTGPHAGPAAYRVIECADHFCALYRTGEVVTVPVGAIVWASSTPNASSPSH